MTKKRPCWSGYHRVSGTKQGTPGSCAKNKFNMKSRKSKRRLTRNKKSKRRLTRNKKSKRRLTKSCKPTGNKRSAKMVNGKCIRFGYKPMPIKMNIPSRKRSFCARHRCSKKRDKATAGYQSCKAWRCKTG